MSEPRHFASSVDRLPATVDAPSAGREAASKLLGQLGAGQGRADDLALVVSELVTNAVLHGPGPEIELRLEGTWATIRIEVSDEGVEPFEWPVVMDGHRGLGFVRIFSERSGVIRRPWTVVWCELDLNGSTAR